MRGSYRFLDLTCGLCIHLKFVLFIRNVIKRVFVWLISIDSIVAGGQPNGVIRNISNKQ